MGREAYGLVGFFTLLSSWLNLLNLGLSGTLGRETASFRAGSIDALTFRKLVKTLIILFVIIGAFVGFLLIIFSDFIATNWLKSQSLPHTQLKFSICIMGIIFALRFPSGIQRSVIIGYEKQVLLNIINITLASLRYIGVVLIFIFVGKTPIHFFSFQVLIIFTELLIVSLFVYNILPKVTEKIYFSFLSLRRTLRFSISIAITSSIWVVVTQTDKLLLSTLLNLEDYAAFSIAVMVAGTINYFSGPIGQAVLPRLTVYSTSGDLENFNNLYLKTTQTLSAIALPVSLTIALTAKHLLFAWTGNSQIADIAWPVLTLYSLGNGFLSIAAVTYYIQYSKGDLSLHLKANLVFLALLLPLIIIFTKAFGMVGAGFVWFGSSCMFLFIWSYFVHKKFAPGIHRNWLLKGVLLPFFFGAIPSIFALFINFSIFRRFSTLFIIGAIAITSIFLATISNPSGRLMIFRIFSGIKYAKFR